MRQPWALIYGNELFEMWVHYAGDAVEWPYGLTLVKVAVAHA